VPEPVYGAASKAAALFRACGFESHPPHFTVRSMEEIRLVQALHNEGLNQCEIARRTGIPRGTIRDWVTGAVPKRVRRAGAGCPRCGHDLHDPQTLPAREYSYLLGMYLGDGCISMHARGVHRLRIVLDMRYPKVIAKCAAAMRAVLPMNTVLIRDRVSGNAAEVGAYSKQWPCLFPQHGPGWKHKRQIVLTDWQRDIVGRNPQALIRGLIHSDGCRVSNRSNGRVYPRYFFDQVSDDIRGIFCDACDALGIAWRQSRWKTISIARAESVAVLDSFVGPKT
jgi:hypothetical protein